jgi:hypothetical protein
MLPWTCSNPLFYQSVHCCGGQITILLDWIGLEVFTCSWHLQYENLILDNPQLNFRNPIHSTPHELHYETWDPLHTCKNPTLARSILRVLNPKVVVILGSTRWSEHTREMFAPLWVPVFFFFWVNFMMYPKWRWSTGRSNRIWLEAKYEGKFWWTHPSLFWATYLNCMKRFGDFLNFLSKSNERKSQNKKILKILIFSLVPNVFPSCS